ncbi:hypothetical protein GSI_01603 [Ganoderma sinense ZZ0214-1]|uniref:DUF1793-domain-containing protein n=1 Tax=Ganoderma sinense ZZ0214-1 TaxID=1077348 RepID=A0A2G8SQF0_9APHY|nr:hypothetical protein GSI_01603 [Ganoderma sinense ZZ0214-1]
MNVWYEKRSLLEPAAQANMGWAGKIRVNGTAYKWMGQDDRSKSASVTNIQITPTRSIFVIQAGPMNLTVTFLSPIEADDWVKQSIPFSYVSVEAQSLDGNSYPVQLYSDISAEWVSGDRSSQVRWSNANTGSSIYHEIQLQSPQQNSEIANQAQDGTVYYAMSTAQPNISWQIDRDETTRAGFQTNGILTNTMSTAFSSISPNYTVFGLAVDLGTIQSTSSPITWSVGYVRDPAVTYTTATGAMQQRRPYYVTQYANISDVIDAFTGDFTGAYDRAVALDQKIMSAASQISSQYSDIVSLATRQTMGALDITIATDSSGHLVPGDVKIFMKNLGTDRRVNAVEHIFAAFPMYLYLNASLGGALLEPLLEVQVSRTGQPYAAQDLGDVYPTATDPTVAPTQGVEQTGNMLIMELAHARISGNGTLLSRYYSTTKRWADYLVCNAIKSVNQTNKDQDKVVDSANIALKGVIGVKAMAEIAHALGQDSDAVEYGNQSTSLLSSWLSLATSMDGSHLLGTYGDQESWSLMYNLFSDKMLGLNLVSQSVIDTQTRYLSSLLAKAPEWGLPIDSTAGQFGNAAWSLYASAFVSDTTVRDSLIESVYNHANFNQTVGAFPERYNVTSNAVNNGRAGPALGGLFSHLVLTVPNQTISADSPFGPDGTGNGGPSSNAGAIADGVIGGLAFVGIVVAAFVVLRRRRAQQHEEAGKPKVMRQVPPHPTVTPYYQDSTTGFTGTTAALAGIEPDPYEGVGVIPPSKAKASPNRPHHDVPFESIATSDDSQAGSAWSRGLLSPAGAPSVSPTDVLGLRTEVENLRRVIHDIRAERLEPPPEYIEG